ncbi:MAG: M3 family oligoendopeptidase [Candidatus Eremiobacteraeota bacterium]|nr:M3 family oligoendopeptidase [Candidatus Eremiobacteraeota bacterium]
MTFRTVQAVVLAVLAAAGGNLPSARGDLYYASPRAEEADRVAAYAAATALRTTTVGPRTPAGTLLASLRRYDDVLRRLHRHHAYLQLRASENVSDPALARAVDELDIALDAVSAAMTHRLGTIDDGRRARLERDDPRLRPYDDVLRHAHAAALHTLPDAQELVAAQLDTPFESWLGDEYRRIARASVYPTVTTPSGPVDPRSAAATESPDHAVRRAAAEARAQVRASAAPTFADLLLEVVRVRTASARLHGFADAPSAAYFHQQLTAGEVHAVVDAVRRAAGANEDYQRLLAAVAARQMPAAEVRSYDVGLPPAGFAPPSFSFDDARTILPRALAPLGPTYVAQYTALLDPRNGRLDLAGGADRDRTGYSQGFPGTVSSVYLSPYAGTLGDLRTLIHEGGHATHRELMNQHGVLPVHATGPKWMFEAFAIFNELLLYDDLQRTATTPAWKAYYLDRFVDDAAFQVFESAQETDLEESLYRGVGDGSLRTAKDVDALTLRVLGAYDIWPADEPGRQSFWIGRSLYWRDPLYSVNYLYAGLLATEFFRLKERDPDGFAKRYVALLQNGFDDTPQALLRRFLGIDLRGTGIVDDAVAVIREKTNALRAAQPAP